MQQEVEIMKPQKTWFFTDSTGRTFATNEKEAFNLLTENSGWRRKDIKMVGCSDGTTYAKVISESKQATLELQEKVSALKEKLDLYIKGHDRLVFDEFLDENDPKVQRAKTMIAKVQKEMDPLEAQLSDIKKNIMQKAFDAELEKAKGNLVKPQDYTFQARTDGSTSLQELAQQLTKAKSIL